MTLPTNSVNSAAKEFMDTKATTWLASLILVTGIVSTLRTSAEDWYRWRGPDLNGVSQETGWDADWGLAGPKILWKENVGTGFSSVAVQDARVYTMGNQDDKDTVYCLDTATGAEIWIYSYEEKKKPKYYEGGPSVTPTIDGNRVYTLSRSGKLFCFEAATGNVLWKLDFEEEYDVDAPTWGFAGSPLVYGDKLILNVGTKGTAVDKRTGKLLWMNGQEEAGYSSAVPFDIGGTKGITMFLAESLIALDPKTGAELWRFPWDTPNDVNAADPIVSGNQIFISSGYGTGGALLEVIDNRPRLVWKSRVMHNMFNSCVLIDGYLYGIHGQEGKESDLRCVKFLTGEVQWAEPSTMFGALTATPNRLIVQGEKGELIIAKANPNRFETISRGQVLGGKCWTAPVLSNAKIFSRNARGDLVCVDVRPGE